MYVCFTFNGFNLGERHRFLFLFIRVIFFPFICVTGLAHFSWTYNPGNSMIYKLKCNNVLVIYDSIELVN